MTDQKDVLAQDANASHPDDLERVIKSLIRNHSSPTVGRGDIHGGQLGYILYEPGVSFVAAGLRRHLQSATRTPAEGGTPTVIAPRTPPALLLESLRNPAWAHSKAPFESPQLAKEECVEDMLEAASQIEGLCSEIDLLESKARKLAQENEQIRALVERLRGNGVWNGDWWCIRRDVYDAGSPNSSTVREGGQ